MLSLLKRNEIKRGLMLQLEKEIEKEFKKPTGKFKVTSKQHTKTGGLVTAAINKSPLTVEEKYDLLEAKDIASGEVYLKALKNLADPDNIEKAKYSRETTQIVKDLLKTKHKGVEYKMEVVKFSALKNKLKHQRVKGELLYTPKQLRVKLLEHYKNV